MNDVQTTVKQHPELARRLTRAVEHVSKMWLPLNVELFSHLRKSAAEGLYDLDVDFLINDLKTDLSLFAYCVREAALRKEKKDHSGTSQPLIDKCPTDLLKEAGVATLKEILTVESTRVTEHQLKDGTPQQLARFRDAMLAASVAQTLAPYHDVEPDLGFSSAILRQLGQTLIAWNYPNVYKRCLDAAKKGSDLDVEISNALGFSPVTLTIALFNSWGLAPSIIGHPEKPAGAHTVTARIQKICTIGEALARANDPEQYPTALHDWEIARKGLADTLGPSGLSLIQETLRRNASRYATLMPEIFQEVSKLDPEKRLYSVGRGSVERNNPFVQSCAPAIRKKIEEVYGRLGSGGISKENVQTVIRDIVPTAGFSGGHIFVFEPGSLTLVPRVRFGSAERTVSGPIPYLASEAQSDPVVAAFKCRTTIIDNIAGGSQSSSTFMAACLGEQQKAGVLYLEAPDFSLAAEDNQLLNHFRVIRQLLMDCLGVV